MTLIERFKRDILKHRGRSAVLGVLFVVMVVLSIKAVFEMQVRPVSASVLSAGIPGAPKISEPLPDPSTTADAQERLNQSTRLWQTLQHVSPTAVKPEMAFAFNASFYPQVVVPETAKTPDVDPQPAKIAPAPAPAIDTEAVKAARIREQARALVLKTTAVAPDIKPMAIVNQQLLTVGQEILGFEITAIRAREVEFCKDGITVVVKMPDGQ